MNRNVAKILKELGLWKIFIGMLILRAPFDFLNAVLNANMLEEFLRLIERNEGENLMHTFWKFMLFSFLLFAYNATVWMTISIKADMLLHRKLRMKLLDVMLSRTQQEMEELSAGDWITRINSDVDKTADYLTCPLNFMHAAIATVNFVLSSVILLKINVSLFVVAILVMVPFFILSGIVITRKIPYYRKKSQEAFAEYTNWMEPIIEAGDAICVFEGQELVMQKVEEASEEILKENVKAHRLTAWSSFFNVMSGNLGYLLLLILGNSMIGSKVKDFAELTKITQYRGGMMQSVMCVNTCLNQMRTNLSGAMRVDEIMHLTSCNPKESEEAF